MSTVLLVIHVFITITLVIVVLLQKSEGGGLGIGGGTFAGLRSRAAANALSKTTSILATLFMLNCLVMAVMNARQSHNLHKTIIEDTTPAVPQQIAPEVPTSNQPNTQPSTQPQQPEVPLAQ